MFKSKAKTADPLLLLADWLQEGLEVYQAQIFNSRVVKLVIHLLRESLSIPALTDMLWMWTNSKRIIKPIKFKPKVKFNRLTRPSRYFNTSPKGKLLCQRQPWQVVTRTITLLTPKVVGLVSLAHLNKELTLYILNSQLTQETKLLNTPCQPSNYLHQALMATIWSSLKVESEAPPLSSTRWSREQPILVIQRAPTRNRATLNWRDPLHLAMQLLVKISNSTMVEGTLIQIVTTLFLTWLPQGKATLEQLVLITC